MLELFKGQISLHELQHKIPWREALLLRDSRIERLKKEKNELDSNRSKEEEMMRRQEIANKILAP